MFRGATSLRCSASLEVHRRVLGRCCSRHAAQGRPCSWRSCRSRAPPRYVTVRSRPAASMSAAHATFLRAAWPVPMHQRTHSLRAPLPPLTRPLTSRAPLLTEEASRACAGRGNSSSSWPSSGAQAANLRGAAESTKGVVNEQGEPLPRALPRALVPAHLLFSHHRASVPAQFVASILMPHLRTSSGRHSARAPRAGVPAWRRWQPRARPRGAPGRPCARRGA